MLLHAEIITATLANWYTSKVVLAAHASMEQEGFSKILIITLIFSFMKLSEQGNLQDGQSED